METIMVSVGVIDCSLNIQNKLDFVIYINLAKVHPPYYNHMTLSDASPWQPRSVTSRTSISSSVKMAEAAAAPRHRYFCHCCKDEIDPKLPVSTKEHLTDMHSVCSHYYHLKGQLLISLWYGTTNLLLATSFVFIYVRVKPCEEHLYIYKLRTKRYIEYVMTVMVCMEFAIQVWELRRCQI